MDKMMLAVRAVLSKYITFSGRASRSEYWWWILAIFLLSALTQLIDALVIAPMLGIVPAAGDDASQPLSLILSLAILLPTVAVGVRRLHDIGRSGWWLLLSLIPLIGFLVLLYFYTRPSDPENEWGPPNPLY
ncbi:MAG: DUF805 domain-containing protein [Paracoccaceae bacterium]|nr:DUF805 domain-containing protein [Paracoccaceae bacterium]